MKELLDIIKVRPRANYQLLLEFENGEKRLFDMPVSHHIFTASGIPPARIYSLCFFLSFSWAVSGKGAAAGEKCSIYPASGGSTAVMNSVNVIGPRCMYSILPTGIGKE